MPRIRTLTRDSETPTLTTFSDPATPEIPGSVLVTTDADTGVPTAVSISENALELINTIDDVRSWAAQIGGTTHQVNTIGGYPGMAANAAG